MEANKTIPSKASVTSVLAALEDAPRRAKAQARGAG